MLGFFPHTKPLRQFYGFCVSGIDLRKNAPNSHIMKSVIHHAFHTLAGIAPALIFPVKGISYFIASETLCGKINFFDDLIFGNDRKKLLAFEKFTASCTQASFVKVS